MTASNDYFVKRLDPKRLSVTKLEPTTGELLQVYVIEDSKCSCPGSMYHKTQCKHLKLREVWLAQGEPQSLYYTIDRKGQITQHKYEGLDAPLPEDITVGS